jgi:hypothetical protein
MVWRSLPVVSLIIVAIAAAPQLPTVSGGRGVVGSAVRSIQTSSMRAIWALSPWRGPSFRMRR